MRQMRYDWKLALFQTVLIVTVSLPTLVLTPLDVDEIALLEASNNLLEYSPKTVHTGFMQMFHHPPLFPILISPLAGAPILCRIMTLLLSICSVFVLTGLIATLNPKDLSKSFITSSVFASTLSFVLVATSIRPDGLMLLLIILTIYFYIKDKKELALLFSMLGVNTKYVSVFALGLILMMNRKDFIRFALADLASLIPFGIWSYLRVGDFLMLKHWFGFAGGSTSIINTGRFLITDSVLVITSIVTLASLLLYWKRGSRSKNISSRTIYGLILALLLYSLFFVLYGMRVTYYMAPILMLELLLISCCIDRKTFILSMIIVCVPIVYQWVKYAESTVQIAAVIVLLVSAFGLQLLELKSRDSTFVTRVESSGNIS